MSPAQTAGSKLGIVKFLHMRDLRRVRDYGSKILARKDISPDARSLVTAMRDAASAEIKLRKHRLAGRKERREPDG